MDRITPEQVVEAYEETGQEPIEGKFLKDSGKKSCAVGALMIQKIGKEAVRYHDYSEPVGDVLGLEMESREVQSHYIFGFYKGFDGEDVVDVPCAFNRGYEDGQACRQEVLEVECSQ